MAGALLLFAPCRGIVDWLPLSWFGLRRPLAGRSFWGGLPGSVCHSAEFPLSSCKEDRACSPCLVFPFLIGFGGSWYHIVISDGNTYSGLITENYIAPFGAYDFVALVFIFLLVFLCSLALHLSFRTRLEKRQKAEGIRFGACRLDMKLFVAGSVLIMLLWLPYLLAFSPGFIFGDTISSISQAIGDAPLSNHHPVFYTMLIKCAFKVAALFGYGRTTGLALLSAIQMLFLAGSFAYSASWVHARLRTPKMFHNCLLYWVFPGIGGIFGGNVEGPDLYRSLFDPPV